MKKPRGVALHPNHKKLLVADMRLNAVLTFYFTEIFQCQPDFRKHRKSERAKT